MLIQSVHFSPFLTKAQGSSQESLHLPGVARPPSGLGTLLSPPCTEPVPFLLPWV